MENKIVELTLYENSRFHVRENLDNFNMDMIRKSYMKIDMDFVEGLRMKNKIFAYMRISTNHQKTDRQKQTIIEYSINNGFNIDEFVSDVITGGRNADDVIVEIKDLQAKGIRVVALDVPFLNDWEKMNDDSLSKMIIDIFVTLKAHIAQGLFRIYTILWEEKRGNIFRMQSRSMNILRDWIRKKWLVIVDGTQTYSGSR